MRRIILLLGLIMILAVQVLVFSQDTGVYAEAIIRANLRAAGDINAEAVGEITSGTRYPVIGRNEFAVSTWYLLGARDTFQPIGWVYFEVVTVYGDINVVPFSSVNVNALPTATPPPPTVDPNTDAGAGETVTTNTPLPTFTPTPDFSVFGLVNNEVNIRYGPGIDFPRVGVATAGDRFEIVGYHTQFPWVQIAYPDAPNSVAWAATSVLDIQGDIFTTRPITNTDFSILPTLTPTAAVLQASSVDTGAPPVSVSAELMNLGNQLWNSVLEANFDPLTSRFGALYLHDLATGEEITFGNQYAFSGTSINKIPILVTLFGVLDTELDARLATDIANTMICSENVATNRLLEVIGAGDVYQGAEDVSLFLQQLGLTRTFLTAPYEIPGVTPEPPPRPIRYPDTDADQEKALPNLTNQITVDEMGYLLSTVYECGVNESGPLLENFSGYTPQECRKMLHVMSNNNVDALLKAGVPASIPVAHKHGWVADTHGNAAVFFTPERDYVMVMMLHQPDWLQYEESLPVIANASRAVYNFYNPETELGQVREGFIPDTADCNYQGSTLVEELVSPYFALELPFEPRPLVGP